jgi:hypothetical protein
VWYAGDGHVVGSDGEPVMRLGAGITHDLVPRAMGVLPDDGLVTEVRVRGNNTRLDSPSFVSLDAGVALVAWTAEEGTFTSLIALGDGSLMSTRMGGLFPAGTASGLRFVVNYCQQGEDCAFAYGRPAVYSVLDGRLHELAGLDAGRRLIGSQRGPFARVLPGAECWPIRESLELRNETIVWCAQPGEPLTLYDLEPIESYYPGQPRILHSEGLLDYVRVLAPNGEPGWIRVDAVEVGPMPER